MNFGETIEFHVHQVVFYARNKKSFNFMVKSGLPNFVLDAQARETPNVLDALLRS